MDWHNVQGLPALTWLFLWQTCYPKKTSGFRKWIYYLNLKNDHHVFTKIRRDSINWKRLTKKDCGWKRKSELLKWSFSILLLVKNVYCREKANDVTTVLAWREESKPKSRTSLYWPYMVQYGDDSCISLRHYGMECFTVSWLSWNFFVITFTLSFVEHF